MEAQLLMKWIARYLEDVADNTNKVLFPLVAIGGRGFKKSEI